MREGAAVPPEVGAEWSTRLATGLTRAAIARYAGASGDVNSVHVDEPFAAASGFPSVIAHGMLTMGLTGSFLSSIFGHDEVRRFGGRFQAPVFVGDSLDCTIHVTAVCRTSGQVQVDLDLRTSKPDGVMVFVGEALVVLPLIDHMQGTTHQ